MMNKKENCLGTLLLAWGSLFLLAAVLTGCATGEGQTKQVRPMEVTAYCSCGECNSYTRGHWWLLKLDFWNRYFIAGPDKGKPYDGTTASGASLSSYHPGLFSVNTLTHPWMIVPRVLFFPWLLPPSYGTIAADTRYYPFGTIMYVPGWGWGEVQDRGSAIKGPDRLDIFYRFHNQANDWGRQRVNVEIYPPQ